MTRTLEKTLHAEAAKLGMTLGLIRRNRSLIYAFIPNERSVQQRAIPIIDRTGTLRRQAQLAETSTKNRRFVRAAALR